QADGVSRRTSTPGGGSWSSPQVSGRAFRKSTTETRSARDTDELTSAVTRSGRLHRLGERQLDHLFRGAVTREDASHRALLPEHAGFLPAPINVKLEVALASNLGGGRKVPQIPRHPFVHLADQEPAVGAPVHEERAWPALQSVHASTLEAITHHREVE